jgi:hypothetical protein
MKRLVRGLVRTAAREVLKRQAKKAIIKVMTRKPAASAPAKVAPKPTPRPTPKVTPRVAPKAVPKPKPRKEPTMQVAVIGALRHLIQLGAGALVAKGVIDAAGVELVVGAGMSLVTLGWYLVERKLAAKAFYRRLTLSPA